MAGKQKKYDREYKIQAVKLSKEIGGARAAAELGIPVDTLYGWQRAVREGRLDAGVGIRTPQESMALGEEVTALRKQVRELEKENRRLKEENEFLEEASAFFAASRRKSAKGRECVQRHLWVQANVSGAAALAAVRGTYHQRTDGLSTPI